MANKQVQFRRGSSIENDQFVGAEGEITVDVDNNNARLHDGITPGGRAFLMSGDAAGGPGGSGSGSPDYIAITTFQKNLTTPGVFHAFVSPGSFLVDLFDINLSVGTPPTQETVIDVTRVFDLGTSSAGSITIGTDGYISDVTTVATTLSGGETLTFATDAASDLGDLAITLVLAAEPQEPMGPIIE